MLFRAYLPCAPLGDFIVDFRLYENYAGDHPREKILPSGTVEMVFNLRDDELRIYGPSERGPCRRFTGALISGPYAGAFMTDTAEEAAILQVHFKPGGARAVLGLPAGELANTHVDLETIWGSAATVLRAQLCLLYEPMAQFRLLEQALLQRLFGPSSRHGTVRAALDVLTRSDGRAKVCDIAKALDLSQRRFIEVFTAEVGLTPKLFGRVRRFQRALALSPSATKIDWAQIAVACGYFDQSHLIRDFVAFSGVTPSDYWRRQNELDRAGIHVKRHHLPLAE